MKNNRNLWTFQEPTFESTIATSDPPQPLLPPKATDDMKVTQASEPSQLRKLDMGDLMGRTNVTKRLGLRKPNQFKVPKYREYRITRLPPFDENATATPLTVKTLGKGSGKDGRLFVADLLRLRENESRFVEEFI